MAAIILATKDPAQTQGFYGPFPPNSFRYREAHVTLQRS